MPAASPFMDFWAPAQWRIGSPQAGPDVTGQVHVNSQETGFDTTLHWKVSGAIILALVIIFGLQALGFRFVVAANTSVGVG